jgi:catechol 2,3-dioxygenase-like lactoylglutathione lyase family enzyme
VFERSHTLQSRIRHARGISIFFTPSRKQGVNSRAMSVSIHELNHVMIRVTDLEASDRFYGEILGLRRIPRPAFDFPGSWFALGAQELHLIGDPTLSAATRVHHHYALRIDDTMAARQALEAKGWTKLRGPKRRPDGAMQLFVTDPDGYEIELMAPAKA